MGGGGGGGRSYRDRRSSTSTSDDRKRINDKEKEAEEKISDQIDEIDQEDYENMQIFISHQNRDEEKTQRVHDYADYLQENSEFKVWIDKEHFPKTTLTNLSKIDEIIRQGMSESQIFLAFYHPVKDSNRYERSDWINLEAQKAKYRGLPIIHVFLDGSRDSGVVESSKSYKIHYKKGEHWKKDLIEKIKEIARKHEITK